MKITYLGKEVRDRRGRFARTRKWIGRIGIFCFAVIMAGAIYADRWNTKELSVVAPVYAGETMQARVEAELDKVINQIAQAESQGSKTEDALITIDDNKAGSLPRKDKVSIGCMQYKVSTVQRHWKLVHGEDLNNYQAVMVALDCDK